ncbi:MAG: hypothetical protein IIU31_06040 [Pseudobutyrivibrio sp.]|nr:hypothetical protein [Pseudobutyrivibrio sp.]
MKEKNTSFKNLSAKQKLQYVWDYYKIHIIVTVVLICAIFSIIKTIKASNSADLYVAYVNVAVDEDMTNALEDQSGLIISSYRDLLITEDPSGENLQYAYASSMKLMSAISAEKLDIIIGDFFAMDNANSSDYLLDPEEFIKANNPSLLDEFEPLFLRDDAGKPYAIDISGFSPFSKAGYTEPIYLGIIASDTNIESKLSLLSTL